MDTFTVEQIAEIAYSANQTLCLLFGEDKTADWKDAENWRKASYIRGVEQIIANPNATPRDHFEWWKQDKLEQGWVYGLVKDSYAKTHPCIVEYDELPSYQKAKDNLIQSITKALSLY